MGEAILTRSGGSGPTEVIPSDSSIVVLTLTDSSGNPAVGIPVQCNDGGTLYNFATNTNGQALFSSLKSGWANFNISTTYSNGISIADQISNGWYNFEAPFGKNTTVEAALSPVSASAQKSIVNGQYLFLVNDIVNLNMAGGVGGSGGFYQTYWSGPGYSGGSGGGAQQFIGEVSVSRNTIYNAIAGEVGTSGSRGHAKVGNFTSRVWATDGSSGGTSTFIGKSAVGGGGGEAGGASSNGNSGTSFGSWRGAGYIIIY